MKCCRGSLLIYGTDFRRYVRPFFLTPDGQETTSLKIYYDGACYLFTQAAFAFCVAPFVMLRFEPSFTIWARVYFYAVIWVAACVGFLSSPGKGLLIKQLKAYQKTGVQEHDKHDSAHREPTLSVPDDPEATFDEIVADVKAEIARRRKDGEKIPDVMDLIRETLEDWKKNNRIGEHRNIEVMPSADKSKVYLVHDDVVKKDM